MLPPPKSKTVGNEHGGPAARLERPIAFVQPFGIEDVGGGAKILRSLLENPPLRCVSLIPSTRPPKPTTVVQQVHVPLRPFARLQQTRLSRLFKLFDAYFRHKQALALCRSIGQLQPRVIHVVVEPGCDLAVITGAARDCAAYLAACFHDHPSFFIAKGRKAAFDLESVGAFWRNADLRFVISPELGNKLCQDFGRRDFEVVTDGVTRVGAAKPISGKSEIVIYFMGMFHAFYGPNFDALGRALEIIGRDTAIRFTLKIRSNCFPAIPSNRYLRVQPLPFADDATVDRDMEQADLLYLPLPFSDEGRSFAEYSLSTKMISYLASGRPILYHGPPTAAAGRLLESSGAAMCANSPDAEAIVSALRHIFDRTQNAQCIVEAALALARTRFDLRKIRARFWERIVNAHADSPRQDSMEHVAAATWGRHGNGGH
jgi:glycosyltransferase involved in cell wall biosynthesis